MSKKDSRQYVLPIQEGLVKKGGLNAGPSTPRPRENLVLRLPLQKKQKKAWK